MKDSINPPNLVLPKAKTKDIVIQQVDNELLVYDLSNDKAHHLNRTSTLIWKKCDGKTPIAEVTKLLSKEMKTEIEEDFVWLALDELRKVNLLENSTNQSTFPKLSRRKVLFRYALPTIALPIVVSLAAPEVIHAQSCSGGGVAGGGNMDIDVGGTCEIGNTDCCPGLVCVTGMLLGTCQLPTPE